MIKIGITGSLASGKTTASKILSHRNGPLFSADKVVKELYKNKHINELIRKKLRINKNDNVKKSVKKLILEDFRNIGKIENIIHPLVRKRMKSFTSLHKNKKFLFYEIPLLIESKLMRFFDLIIFIKSKKKIRLKRFKSKKGDENLFNILNDKQMNDKKKLKFCDHVVVNENNLNILKKRLSAIMRKYE